MRHGARIGARRLIAGLALAVAALCAPPPAPARAAAPSGEYDVKAAMLYNFARFTEWPADAFAAADAPLRLVVVGDAGALAGFRDLAGRSVGGHPLDVLVTTRPEDAAGCHLLFLARSQRETWQEVNAALGNGPTLTVGEMNGFLESGGALNLELAGGTVRFQVNLDNTRARALVVSSRILKLASEVVDSRRAPADPVPPPRP